MSYQKNIQSQGVVFYGNLVFSCGFDDGTANGWFGDGGGGLYGQETGGQLIMESSVVKTGLYSGKFLVPDPSSGSQIKLLRWRGIDLTQGYYSAWYYFPENFHVVSWINIMQWKEKNDPYSHEIVILAKENPNQFAVFIRFSDQSTYIERCPGIIPLGRWIHIVTYIKVDKTNGEIKVWIDDNLVYSKSGLETKGNSDTIMFGVGNYPSPDENKDLYFYIDSASAGIVYIPS